MIPISNERKMTRAQKRQVVKCIESNDFQFGTTVDHKMQCVIQLHSTTPTNLTKSGAKQSRKRRRIGGSRAVQLRMPPPHLTTLPKDTLEIVYDNFTINTLARLGSCNKNLNKQINDYICRYKKALCFYVTNENDKYKSKNFIHFNFAKRMTSQYRNLSDIIFYQVVLSTCAMEVLGNELGKKLKTLFIQDCSLPSMQPLNDDILGYVSCFNQLIEFSWFNRDDEATNSEPPSAYECWKLVLINTKHLRALHVEVEHIGPIIDAIRDYGKHIKELAIFRDPIPTLHNHLYFDDFLTKQVPPSIEKLIVSGTGIATSYDNHSMQQVVDAFVKRCPNLKSLQWHMPKIFVSHVFMFVPPDNRILLLDSFEKLLNLPRLCKLDIEWPHAILPDDFYRICNEHQTHALQYKKQQKEMKQSNIGGMNDEECEDCEEDDCKVCKKENERAVETKTEKEKLLARKAILNKVFIGHSSRHPCNLELKIQDNYHFDQLKQSDIDAMQIFKTYGCEEFNSSKIQLEYQEHIKTFTDTSYFKWMEFCNPKHQLLAEIVENKSKPTDKNDKDKDIPAAAAVAAASQGDEKKEMETETEPEPDKSEKKELQQISFPWNKYDGRRKYTIYNSYTDVDIAKYYAFCRYNTGDSPEGFSLRHHVHD